MCGSCDGTRSLDSALGLLGRARAAHLFGLGPVVREDVHSLAYLLEREAALAAELRPLVTPMGQAYFDTFSAALAEFADGAPTVTQVELTAMLQSMESTLKDAATQFSTTAGPVVGEHSAGMYSGVRAVSGVAEVAADFVVVDEAAVAWMKQDPAWWIGEHYGPGLSKTLQDTGVRALEQGLGRMELAAQLEARLATQYTGYAYWDVLSSAQLNRSRTWGEYENAQELGYSRLSWSTVGDERVCPTCGPLEGSVFSVGSAVQRKRQIVSNGWTPDQYRDKTPWVNNRGKGADTEWYWKDSGGEEHDVTNEFSGMNSGAADSAAGLQNIGVDGPAIHGRCRCMLLPLD